MLAALILFAQEAAQKGADEPTAPPWGGMLPILILMAAFFFIVILPAQRKEKKQREAIMSNLKKNDEVLTSSGFIGIVQNVKPEEDELVLKLDDNCKVRIKKSSIAQILKAKEEPAPDTRIQK